MLCVGCKGFGTLSGIDFFHFSEAKQPYGPGQSKINKWNEEAELIKSYGTLFIDRRSVFFVLPCFHASKQSFAKVEINTTHDHELAQIGCPSSR